MSGGVGGSRENTRRRRPERAASPHPVSRLSSSEPLVRSDALLASLDPSTRSRVTVHHADVSDCDLASLFAAAVPPGTPVLLFCNNLAFPPGTAVRHGRQYAAFAEGWGGPVTLVTSMPIDAGVGRAPDRVLPLTMNFNDAHDVCVYEWSGGEAVSKGTGERRAAAACEV